jgi:hypothetical protein
MEYLKYRFLIDSTYEEFKNKSQEFLNKKVSDVDGRFVKYIHKGKYLDGILVQGISKKMYIIAYDKTNSYVFASPTQEGEHYIGGKYICMVDQSSIKSNIGYDTLISKLMALRNDSIIAPTIYNLQTEIESEEENEDNE